MSRRNFNIQVRKYEPYIVVEDDQQWKKLNRILLLIFPKVINPIIKSYLESYLIWQIPVKDSFVVQSVTITNKLENNGFYRRYQITTRAKLRHIKDYITQQLSSIPTNALNYGDTHFTMAVSPNKFYATEPVELFEYNDETRIYKLVEKKFYKYNKLDKVPTRWDGKELAANQSTEETYYPERSNEAKWYSKGVRHRYAAPAVVISKLTETFTGQLNYDMTDEFQYYYYGKIHRSIGIATSVTTGCSWWISARRLHGVIHRSTGPAIIRYGGTVSEPTSEFWYLYGREHRYNAKPADMIYNGMSIKAFTVNFFIHGRAVKNPRYRSEQSDKDFLHSCIKEEYNEKGEKMAEKEITLYSDINDRIMKKSKAEFLKLVDEGKI